MALFRRRNNQANVPQEIREYYQTERRERAGIAWLLAIGTLIVTILLASGIFFAGRWAYRAVFQDENPNPDQNQVAQGEQKQEEQPASNGTSPQQAAQPQNPQQQENNQNSGGEGQEQQNQSNEAQNQQQSQEQPQPQPAPNPEPAPAPAPAPTPENNAQPSAGSSEGQVAAAQSAPLPTTGPANVLTIFLGVSAAGYILHRLIPAKRI